MIEDIDWLTVAYSQAEEADTKIEELEAEIIELKKRCLNYQGQIKALIREKYRSVEENEGQD